jgi:hypothetical protein
VASWSMNAPQEAFNGVNMIVMGRFAVGVGDVKERFIFALNQILKDAGKKLLLLQLIEVSR